MAYEFGKIWQLVTVFDPVVIEDSGFTPASSSANDQIFLQDNSKRTFNYQ